MISSARTHAVFVLPGTCCRFGLPLAMLFVKAFCSQLQFVKARGHALHHLEPDARLERRRKVLAGDPVEINPSNGFGLKVMTIDEWTSRWKARQPRSLFSALRLQH